MNIDPLSNSNLIPPYRRHASFDERPGQAATSNDHDRLSARLSTSVRDTLAALPDIRPDVVERGRQLLADPNYPGQAIVQKIASLITPLSED